MKVVAPQMSWLKRAEVRIAQRELAAEAFLGNREAAAPFITRVLQFSDCQFLARHVLPRLYIELPTSIPL